MDEKKLLITSNLTTLKLSEKKLFYLQNITPLLHRILIFHIFYWKKTDFQVFR